MLSFQWSSIDVSKPRRATGRREERWPIAMGCTAFGAAESKMSE